MRLRKNVFIVNYLMFLKYFLVGILSITLASCAGGYAVVTDHSFGTENSRQVSNAQNKRISLPTSGLHRVQKGDTLYSIAWRYGLDYRKLAKMNKIDNNFTIHVGQQLALLQKPIASGAKSSADRTQDAEINNKNSSISTPAESVAATEKSAPKPNSSQTNSNILNNSGPLVWNWPVKGDIITRYSARSGGSKGVSIAGKLGTQVKAAARGRVVYAGSGLLGYGNLVIINHNQEYLSAYGHNSRILVSENQIVDINTIIAEMGQTGTNRVQLHFEIRKNGKPVNPVSYLP